jgi:hypothetical protein
MASGVRFIISADVDFHVLANATGLMSSELESVWNDGKLVYVLSEFSVSVKEIIKLASDVTIECTHGYTDD